jgi:hypothetical protein
MSPQIFDKCYKAAAILIPVEMGSSFAAAKCCPACYQRIYGNEELEQALKELEDSKKKEE